jgi:hypothetical protein
LRVGSLSGHSGVALSSYFGALLGNRSREVLRRMG